jgi:YesN/AraC family two-component response regulator
LGITPQYLSRFFKQETGENMVEYINRLRIEKAKYLLSEKDLSILNVSEMVGYGNDRNLNRVFKQREGITPGKYRESIFRTNG